MQIQAPTEDTYQAFLDAYDHFNGRLFDGQLPNCLITLRNNGKSRGYFSPNRFASPADRATTDEIAMNPKLFLVRTLQETLSTLVHEQVHLWQQHFGKPGRKGYHNKEWANKMEAIGLIPSNTGSEGGKKTGGKVTHFIVPGPFSAACEEFIRAGKSIRWGDVDVEIPPDGQIDAEVQETLASIPGAEKQKKPKKSKVKFSCPRCEQNLWGKPGSKAMCGFCRLDLVEEHASHEDA